MEPARVSSPQVDLTRYGLDKTLTLLILCCLGVDPLRPKGKEVPATDARPRWQSRGEARRGQKELEQTEEIVDVVLASVAAQMRRQVEAALAEQCAAHQAASTGRDVAP